MKLGGAFLLAGLLAVGCTSQPSPEEIDASLREATASAVATKDPASIVVLDHEKTIIKWTWKARVDGKLYECDADQKMRLPSCRQSA